MATRTTMVMNKRNLQNTAMARSTIQIMSAPCIVKGAGVILKVHAQYAV